MQVQVYVIGKPYYKVQVHKSGKNPISPITPLQGRNFGQKSPSSCTLHVMIFLLLSLQGRTPKAQATKYFVTLSIYKTSILFLGGQRIDFPYTLHTKDLSFLPHQRLAFFSTLRKPKNNLISFPSSSRKLNQFSNS